MSKNPSDLQARSQKYARLDFLLIGLLLIANLFLAYFVIRESSLYSVFVSCILFALSYLIHLSFSHGLFKLPKARLIEFGSNQKIGRYRAGKIYLMVRELLAPHKGKEQPKVYITFQKYDGAFALNSLFFNFIKPLNAVYISQHLFQILKPNEVKAILAHELAHFYEYIRPLNRVRFALMGFNALFPIYLSLADGQITFWKAFLIWAVFSAVFNVSVNLWLGRTSQDHEHLCDLSAARRYGVLSVANGLFGVCKTAEIQAQLYNAIIKRIRRDNTLSIQKLDELIFRCEQDLPSKAIGQRHLKRLVSQILESNETNEIRKPLSSEEQVKEEKQIQKAIDQLMLNRDFKVLDWKRFDYVIPDGRLGYSEYRRLIRTLASCPEHQLFEVGTDNIEESKNSTHPTVAQRILFLEHARKLDPSIPI